MQNLLWNMETGGNSGNLQWPDLSGNACGFDEFWIILTLPRWACEQKALLRTTVTCLDMFESLNMERTPIALSIALVVYLMVSKDCLLLWAWGSIAVIPSMTAVWIAGLKREGWMRNNESRETIFSSRLIHFRAAHEAMPNLQATLWPPCWQPATWQFWHRLEVLQESVGMWTVLTLKALKFLSLEGLISSYGAASEYVRMKPNWQNSPSNVFDFAGHYELLPYMTLLCP